MSSPFLWEKSELRMNEHSTATSQVKLPPSALNTNMSTHGSRNPSRDPAPSLTPQHCRSCTCLGRWSHQCRRWACTPGCRGPHRRLISGSQCSQAETVTEQHFNLRSPLHQSCATERGARDISPSAQVCRGEELPAPAWRH